MIYFDNAATTKSKPKEVVDAVVYAMTNIGNSSRGVYSESLSADRIVFECRKKISNFFNVGDYRRVIFTKNATEALNTAIFGIFCPNDHIITTVSEHNSVLRPINYMKKRGCEVSYIGVDEKGILKLNELDLLKRKNTKAVVITHASNVTGNLTNLDYVGKFCRKNDILLIVDASQTAGAIDIDMEKMNIDILCFSGHKSMLGPQGTGVLCVKKGVEIAPLMSGGTGFHSYNEFQPSEFPSRLEAGTLNNHGIAGLSAAVDYIKENPDLYEKSIEIMKYFYEKVSHIPEIKIYGDFSNFNRSPICSINILDYDSSQISMILDNEFNISTRPGAHCAPLMHKSFKTVDQGMVRFSFSHSNNFEEVDFAVQALKEIIKRGDNL